MSITELPRKAAKKTGGILEKMVMHGVDAANPPKEVAEESLMIHLGEGGKVLGVGPKGADFSKFGKVKRKVTAPPGMDLDNLPDTFGGMSTIMQDFGRG